VRHTQQIARRYFDAWTAGDSSTVANAALAGLPVRGGDIRIDGRDAFLDAAAYQDDVAFRGAG
jgi:hypothetical protein